MQSYGQPPADIAPSVGAMGGLPGMPGIPGADGQCSLM